MGSITKAANWILGTMLAVQLLLLLLASHALVAALAPPLLAAAPLGYVALRSERNVRAMASTIPRAYISIFILSLAVAATFAFVNDLSFKLQIARALLADTVILWLVATLTVHVRVREERRTMGC